MSRRQINVDSILVKKGDILVSESSIRRVVTIIGAEKW